MYAIRVTALRYDKAGRLVGITVVNARELLERDGAIVVSPRQIRMEADSLRGVLPAA